MTNELMVLEDLNSSFEDQFLEIVRVTGSFIAGQSHDFDKKCIEEKEEHSLVSYVDKEAEKQLVLKLGDLIPECTFLTEEKTVDYLESEHFWIIDPLDGTTNFVQGIPHFSVSVALKTNGGIAIGAVYDPIKKEMFHAVKGKGAYLNGTRICVSEKNILSEALMVTGFPYEHSTLQDMHFELFSRFLKQSRGMRRFGSAALDLAYIAAGRMDVYYEHALNIWDIAAGSLLVQEAGGVCSDYMGQDAHLKSGQIVASNFSLHKIVMDQMAQVLCKDE